MPPVVLHFQRGVRSEDLGDLLLAFHDAGIPAIREELKGGGFVVSVFLRNHPTGRNVYPELRLAAARWVAQKLPDRLNPTMMEELEAAGEGDRIP